MLLTELTDATLLEYFQHNVFIDPGMESTLFLRKEIERRMVTRIDTGTAKPSSCGGSPSSLVAIICAARACHDRELERAARRELEDQFAITLSFRRNAPGKADHGSS